MSIFPKDESEAMTGFWSLKRVVLSICDWPLDPDQFNWSFLEPSSAALLSEGVCWCDCVMIMKLGPRSLSQWRSDRLRASAPTLIYHSNDRFLSHYPPPPSSLSFSFSLSVSPSVVSRHLHLYLFSCSLTLDECCCVRGFSLKPFSLWVMNISSGPTQPPPHPLHALFLAAPYLMQVICQTPTPYYLFPLSMWCCLKPLNTQTQKIGVDSHLITIMSQISLQQKGDTPPLQNLIGPSLVRRRKEVDWLLSWMHVFVLYCCCWKVNQMTTGRHRSIPVS